MVTLPDRLENALTTSLVWPDPLSIVCARDHPLASITGTAGAVSPALLTTFNAVLPARGTVTRTILLDALSPFDVTVETTLETNYLETIKMLITIGLGWSVLPRSMLDDTVRVLQLPDIHIERQLGVIHHVQRTLSNAARAFMDLLDESADRS